MRKTEILDDKAEGDVIIKARTPGGGEYRVPYSTEIASINGCSIHFWLGDIEATDFVLESLERIARSHRDIVYATYSEGSPTSYWAHENMA